MEQKKNNTMKNRNYKDVSNDAIWEASSAKMGTSVAEVIDNMNETFWQSNGSAPHTITATFSEYINLSVIKLYLSCKMDDTYTPKKILIRVGDSRNYLTTVGNFVLNNPNGWVLLHLSPSQFVNSALKIDNSPKNNINSNDLDGIFSDTKVSISELDVEFPEMSKTFRCSVIQIVVVSNFQNGQDSHIRQIRIFTQQNPNEEIDFV